MLIDQEKKKIDAFWLDVQKVLTKNCELDKELTIRCDRHHQQTVKVRNDIDILWRKFN
jgi:hypothetical protein